MLNKKSQPDLVPKPNFKVRAARCVSFVVIAACFAAPSGQRILLQRGNQILECFLPKLSLSDHLYGYWQSELIISVRM